MNALHITSTMPVKLVSAEQLLDEGDAHMVVVQAIEGEMGVCPKHMPFLTQLKPGAVRITWADPERTEAYFVSGGLLEVQSEGVVILADTGERAEDLDEARVREAQAQARGQLEHAATAAEARLALAEAAAKLQVIELAKRRRR